MHYFSLILANQNPGFLFQPIRIQYYLIFVFRVHYLYFAILLAGLTFFVATVISFLTPPLDRKFVSFIDFSISSFIDLIQTLRLTWWTRFSTAKRRDYEEISKSHKRARHIKEPEKYEDPDKTLAINESMWLISDDSSPQPFQIINLNLIFFRSKLLCQVVRRRWSNSTSFDRGTNWRNEKNERKLRSAWSNQRK